MERKKTKSLLIAIFETKSPQDATNFEKNHIYENRKEVDKRTFH